MTIESADRGERRARAAPCVYIYTHSYVRVRTKKGRLFLSPTGMMPNLDARGPPSYVYLPLAPSPSVAYPRPSCARLASLLPV